MIDTQLLLLTLQQFIILFCFILVGYLLKHFGVLKDVKSLSAALMWVFIPALVFNVFYKNFTVTNFSVAMPYAIAGLVVFLITLVISYPLVKKYQDRIKKNIYWYSLINTNMTYLGFPLVNKIFPELELCFMVFIIAFQIYIFTFGVSMLKPKAEKVSAKGLLSPIIIALALGMICGIVFDLCSIKMPAPVVSILDSAAGCMSPVAMIITGFTLAKLPLSKVFTTIEVYWFTFLRLIAYPVVIGGLAYLLHLWLGLEIGIVKIIIIYLALPMGINTAVFPEANGADGTVGAQCAFISHALCVITLPLIFAVVAIL